ncbi:hypothetical protein SK128_024053 [Halocaridina rubra]|uniref:DSCAM/DSCAML C-terminal domain-containing protein n=1 Tax=Halocaridina rubra TaxID=373956 RepID=A0AAN8WM66_HALRR
MASNQVKPIGNYVIMELTPATWYNLRISAHNNAGSSVAEYECATLTLTGVFGIQLNYIIFVALIEHALVKE